MTDFDQKSTGQGPEGITPVEQTSDNPNVKHLWLIPVDLNFVKSLEGIMDLVIAMLSLIAWICIAPAIPVYCIDAYGGGYSFFEFCAGSTFLTMTLWYIMFVVMINQRLKIVPWRLGQLIILGGFGALYVIAAIVVAARTCHQGSLAAASAFGFLTTIAMAGHFYYSFRLWRETEVPAARAATDTTTQGDTSGVATVTDRY
ncbi:MARVEL domain-containing protein 1-like [Littorina saxatilis]|uniref:MARVEL domain-containing protein n=1 Tax=Littorina saxatilis TaxID=31220 RepID=A0AAN9C1F0_9CAEN